MKRERSPWGCELGTLLWAEASTSLSAEALEKSQPGEAAACDLR